MLLKNLKFVTRLPEERTFESTEWSVASPQMRFRARAGAEQYQLIADVVQAIHVPGEFLCLHLTKDNFRTVVNRNHAGQGSEIIPSYASFDSEVLFFDYRIESRADNQICLECDPGQFLRASRSVKKAPEVTFTLTRKNGLPRITLEAVMVNGVHVTQDIPVKVMKPEDFHITEEPNVPPPEVRVMLPSDSTSLRAVVDKLKSFDKFVSVSASVSGQLVLESTAPSLRIRTVYNGLVAKGAKGNSAGVDPGVSATPPPSVVQLLSKHLSLALKCSTIRHDRMLFCLTTDEVCIVYMAIFNKAGVVTLYLPACQREDDEIEGTQEVDDEDQESDGM